MAGAVERREIAAKRGAVSGSAKCTKCMYGLVGRSQGVSITMALKRPSRCRLEGLVRLIKRSGARMVGHRVKVRLASV